MVRKGSTVRVRQRASTRAPLYSAKSGGREREHHSRPSEGRDTPFTHEPLRAARIASSAGTRGASSSSSITCPYVLSVSFASWPICRATEITDRPSCNSSEQNECRSVYG